MLHLLERLKEIGLKEASNKLIWRIKRIFSRGKFSLILKNKNIRINDFTDAEKISFVNEDYLHVQTKTSKPELMKEAHGILNGLFTVHDHGEVRWDYGTKPWNKWNTDTVRSFHRHDFLITLVRAYKESQNQEFLDAVKNLLNLLPNCYSFDLIAKYDKAIDIAIRILNWTAAASLTKFDLKTDCNGQASRYWYQQIEWMKANMSPGGNHLLLEALALFASGLFFPELSTSKSWKEEGLKIVVHEIYRQVHDDGVHAEQSMFYHQICATHFFKFFTLCNKSKTALPANFQRRLQAMIDYIIAAEKPDGTHPMIGDGDMLVTEDREHWEARELVACYKHGLGGSDDFSAHYHGWFQVYPHFENKKENAPETRAFQDGGHVFFKDGLGQYLFFNCGQFGYSAYPHHGHSDALSVEICLNNQTIAMDAGGYAYRNDPIRHFVRSTSAHNTVMIDGREQSETSGVFNVGKTAVTQLVKWIKTDDFDMAMGMHEGYSPAIHYRKIWLLKKGWKTFIIRDYIVGSGEHAITVQYHLSPDIAYGQPADNKVLFHKSSAYVGSLECWLQNGQISITPKSNSGQPSPVSVISRKAGHYVPSQLLSMQSTRHLPVSLVTIFSGHEDSMYSIDFDSNRLDIKLNDQQFQLDISMENSL